MGGSTEGPSHAAGGEPTRQVEPLLIEAEAVTLTVLGGVAAAGADPTTATASCVCRAGDDLDAAAAGPGPAGESHGEAQERVLIWAPTGRDAAVARTILRREGFQSFVCTSALSFCRELEQGAGAAIVADEVLTLATLARLSRVLRQQPAWSDLPLIVFTRRETPVEAVLDQLLPAANVAVIERPARMHGGEVEARSAGLGRGATFIVRLPLLPQPAARQEPALPAPSPAGGAARARVVIVEDNPDIRECMAELLAAWGFDVAQAGDGRAGLDLIVGDPPAVAIVDVGLPKLDGYEVARAVRAHLPPGRVRLIAMTGYGQPQDRQRALQAGFDEHLVKPVNPDALSRLLGHAAGSTAVAS